MVGIKFIWTNGVLIDLEVNHTICEQFWFDSRKYFFLVNN